MISEYKMILALYGTRSWTPATAADSRSNNNIHKDQNLSSSHVTFIIITILPYTATMIGFSSQNMHRSGARAHRGDAPRSCPESRQLLFASVYIGLQWFTSVCLHLFTISYNWPTHLDVAYAAS